MDYVKIHLNEPAVYGMLAGSTSLYGSANKANFFSAVLHACCNLSFMLDSPPQDRLFYKGGALYYINECMKENTGTLAASNLVVGSVCFVSFYEVGNPAYFERERESLPE